MKYQQTSELEVSQAAVPYAIAWEQGMQVLPQHFQELELRMESLSSAAQGVFGPYSWGFIEVSVNEFAVAKGLLEIKSASGRFPDGTYFRASSKDASRISPIDLEFGEGVVRYALSMPIERFPIDQATPSRFKRHVGDVVADWNDETALARIPRMIPRIELRQWSANDSGYLQLPIALIEGRGGVYKLLPSVPPTTSLQIDTEIGRRIARIAGSIREMLTEQEVSDSDFWDQGQKASSTRSALSAEIYWLEIWVASVIGHPYEVLLRLAGVFGRLSAVLGYRLRPALPCYDHNAPDLAIGEVLSEIEGLLISERCKFQTKKCIELRGEMGYWSGEMPADMSDGAFDLQIVAKDANSLADLSSGINRALICWRRDERRFRELRVKGFAREIVSVVPGGEQATNFKSFLMVRIKPIDAEMISDKQIVVDLLSGLQESQPWSLKVFYQKKVI